MKYLAVAMLSALSLTACSDSKPEPTDKKMASVTVDVNGSSVNIETWYDLNTRFQPPTDDPLRLIQRTDTSAAVAAKTVQFAASFLTGQTTQSFEKQDLRGTAIPGVPNPTISLMVPGVVEMVTESLKSHPPAGKMTTIRVLPKKFYLVYKNLNETGGMYQLHFETSISSHTVLNCLPVDPEATLEQWQANGYQKVKDVMQESIKDCITNRFTPHMDLFLGWVKRPASAEPVIPAKKKILGFTMPKMPF